MKKTIIALIIIILALGGLYAAKSARAPKTPPPNSKEIWAKEGIPVETAAIVRGDMEQTVEVTGDIKALDEMVLSAKIPGRVAGVYAREGDSVSKGMTVVALDADDAQSNLRSAEASLESALSRLSQARTNAKVTKIQTDAAIEQAQSSLEAAKSRLAVAKTPTRSQDRLVAENRVAAAKATLDNKEADYKRNKKLADQGAISQSTLDLVETQYKIAQTDYRSAQEQLSVIKEGGRAEDVDTAQANVRVAKEQLRSAKANAAQNMLRQEDIKSAQASVQQARANVSLARQQLSYTSVKSPISGLLASRNTEPGQVVAAGQSMGSVVNLGSLYFQGDVSETEIDNVSMGQNVKVRIDAIQGKTFQGIVDKIYPSASVSGRNFPVRIRITDKTGAIRPGMFARGSIVIGMSRSVVLVPKDAIEERKGTKMVFIMNGKDKVKRMDVEVLRENSAYTQIANPEGLNVGDIVVTSGRQNLQDNSKVEIER
ncbi:MAG: efflux RND transporter periplasmic adaptor subunit [Armatimonadota bacterium]|nr:efflux RND transporter periplasmic adaptor subunit [bacterium]